MAASLSMPSPITRIRPRGIPACFSSFPARFSARSTRLPCTGISSGVSTPSMARMVSASRVSGTTLKASPANTTSPVCPSRSRSRMSSTFRRAWNRRLGFRSVASMERERSSTMTSAWRVSNRGRGRCSQVGSASASTASNQPVASSHRALRLPRPPPLLSSSGSRSGSTTRRQASSPPLRRCSSQTRPARGSRASSHRGWRKWKESNMLSVSQAMVMRSGRFRRGGRGRWAS